MYSLVCLFVCLLLSMHELRLTVVCLIIFSSLLENPSQNPLSAHRLYEVPHIDGPATPLPVVHQCGKMAQWGSALRLVYDDQWLQ